MPPKRKVPSIGLQRRVRPRREDKWEPEPASPSASEQAEDSDDDSPAEERIDNAEADSEDEDQQDSEDGSSVSSSESHTPKVDLSSVSFGALARAQASLPPPSKNSSLNQETNTAAAFHPHAKSSKPPPVKRSSKHAPQEQTSKRPVKRLREIIPDQRRKPRDPRFDPLLGKVDETKARRAYAFLDEYRETEMADLRAQIKKAKDPTDKEALKRQLMSMESRKKAQKKKDEEQALLAEHRAKEKELVAQGKTPFYLKRSEQKKQLLVGRYEKMSKGQVDRAIERKRKKVVGKEKKELGQLRTHHTNNQ
ncbi:hypothetical protein E4U55_006428 [Claviceps digitariae]|nr:hypothetical protein E4U55_006428 [Claviceps digitariae]